MKLAVLDGWPNLEQNAEREFMRRLAVAGDRVGIEIKQVITSDDIHKADPDCVIATHEFSTKVTHHPTIGLMWSPVNFFKNDQFRLRSILSYDGYIAGSNDVRNFLEDQTINIGHRKPIAEDIILPTTYRRELKPRKAGRKRELCYVGVHWDGHRHSGVLKELARRNLIRIYGPRDS